MGFLDNQFLYKVLFVFLASNYLKIVMGDPKFSGYFIFGDSLVDVGNNNKLKTGAKANYLPYGIDFRKGPTGRFSNGVIAVDYIAKDLGFNDFIPPYATAKGKHVLTGVNYASAGSGILDETGENVGGRFSFNTQLQHHQNVISSIKTIQGNETYTQDYLKKCLYTVMTGSNDYINNYFAPESNDMRQNVSPVQFATTLIERFSQQLNWLYKLGARKFTVSTLEEIGCAPAQKQLFGTGNMCVEPINNALIIFNAELRTLVHNLNQNLKDAKFVIPNLDIPTSGLPRYNGIIVTNAPCCKVSNKGATRGECLPRNVTCSHRGGYWYFDGFHPTQFAHKYYSRQLMLSISQLI